ncbi:DsbA family protein [Kineococcus glutinatus]|uniref:Thioredoxin-like fold domain-containing protein n=1 Tax=Kineococcus glutinatus TaxID=1070872 RepID=A0ABP9HVI4_9ACTN
MLTTTAVLAAVVAVAPVVAVLLARGGEEEAASGAPVPATATGAAGGYVLPGSPAEGEAPRLDVWLDYQCPVCKRFETSSGEALVELAGSGSARVVVHTLSFLDTGLGNDSSSRAAQGAAAAADQGRFAEYTRQVYARQPEQEGDGYTDDVLQEAAEAAGVGDVTRWREALDAGTYAGFVEDVQEAMPDEVEGTPTVQLTAGGSTRALDTTTLLGSDGPAYLREQVDAASAS